MAHPQVSFRTAATIGATLFLLGLAGLALLGVFYPEVILVIGLPLALWQYLLGKRYEAAKTFAIFAGLYCILKFPMPWEIIMPVLFGIGALFILARELLNPFDVDEAEEEESVMRDSEQNLEQNGE